jgi:hypothetical protein
MDTNKFDEITQAVGQVAMALIAGRQIDVNVNVEVVEIVKVNVVVKVEPKSKEQS